MTSFTLEPSGPFSLAASRDFAGGFAAGIGAHGTAAVLEALAGRRRLALERASLVVGTAGLTSTVVL